MKVKKSTSIMIVDQIAPSLEFWQQRLGYTLVAQVPHEDEIGFAILEKDGVEVMLQTRASIAADLPSFLPFVRQQTVVQFVEVDDLDATLAALQGWPQLVAPRTTFYGMREVFVQAPGGYIVGFAQQIQ